jgi:GH15 family glucan-1,4-alpha-glucosidase
MLTANLDLGMIGNGSLAALIDRHGGIVWCCFPSFDGDPIFCSLLSPKQGGGYWRVEVEDFDRAEQFYRRNTAVLVTRLYDLRGGIVEIVDCVPRFKQYDRIWHPTTLLRQIVPIAGTPRLRIEMQPLHGYGATRPIHTSGSNHIRYIMDDMVLRLTADLPMPYIEKSLPFLLERPLHFVLSADETLTVSAGSYVKDCIERTENYWWEWVRYLSIPYDWQDAVIRAAITLKLCQSEATGAIIAAVTTSIPEAANSERNWDYRYCWLRDAAFVVRALNRLGATRSMEEYLSYLFNLTVGDGEIGPVFGITFQRELLESNAPALSGYRGMGPVRIGNDAWRQRQNDVYGSVILATAQLFFDHRIERRGIDVFQRLEPLGLTAARLADQTDAGLWEFRSLAQIHTYSAVMCWAACDRLAKIADHLALTERHTFWREHADKLHSAICTRGTHTEGGHFVAAFDSTHLDASLLLLADIGFVAADDPRFIATVDIIGRELRRDSYLFRYIAPDDFGAPETSFSICTFWYIDALASIGRREEALAMFENMLQRRNSLGLLSEDVDPITGELWGNFPQTYSMVGLINSAMRLSRSWDDAF